MLIKKFTFGKLNFNLNRLYLFVNILCFFFVLISNQSYLTKVCFFLYLVITTILSREKRYLSNGLSLLYNFLTNFYINAPLSFFIYLNNSNFSQNILDRHNNELFNTNSLSSVILKLIIYWVIGWLAIYVFVKKNRSDHLKTNRNNSYLVHPVILFIISLFYMFLIIIRFHYENYNILFSRNNLEIVRFFFSDTIIITYLFAVFLYLINYSTRIYYNLNLQFILLVLILSIALIVTASKAPFLLLFTYYLISIVTLQDYHPKKIFYFLLPNLYLIIFIIIISFFTYVFFFQFRFITVNISLTEFFNNIDLDFYLKKILERISDQFLNSFILINTSSYEYDFNYAVKFLAYMCKRIVNLLLIGTSYPESYISTSQLFENIINNEELLGHSTKEDFIENLNTRPFSGFGIFTILFGFILGPLIFFIYFALINFLFLKTKGIFLKMNLILLFWKTLICFSYEEVVAEFITYYFVIILLHILIKFFSDNISILNKFKVNK